MKIVLLIIMLLMQANACFAKVFTSSELATNTSHAAIIAEKTHVTKGEKTWIALRLQLADGWHSYANPSGESGYATKIELRLPAGVRASPIYWQPATPFYSGDILSYGYAGEVYHFIELDVPSDYAGAELAFEATAEWLVCKDICIPESGKWNVKIPIGAGVDDADFTAKRKGATPNEAIILQAKQQSAPQHNSILWALFSALLGGLVLNLMPCVLPILSLKTLSLVKIADKSRRLSALHGASYTAGTMLGFIGLAGALIAFKASGNAVGWGFQLQSPAIIAALALLMLMIAMNLSDVFELPSFGGGFKVGGGPKVSGGLGGSFFTGLLAVSVATPCTAPFMAGAMGFAITQPPFVQIAIFATLGFGLAAPYLLISLVPRLQKCLPKSGGWLLHFKHFLAFPIYATSAWLAWVLARQAGDAALAILFAGALLCATLLWLIARLHAKKWLRIMAILMLLATMFLTVVAISEPKSDSAFAKMSEPYSATKLEELQQKGRKIFIYATADWCITCKLNERLVLNDADIAAHLSAKNVSVLKADFTNGGADIAALLELHGLAGVPAYIYYNGNAVPIILPNLLSNADILGLK